MEFGVSVFLFLVGSGGKFVAFDSRSLTGSLSSGMLHWLKRIIINIKDKQVFMRSAKLTKSIDKGIKGIILDGFMDVFFYHKSNLLVIKWMVCFILFVIFSDCSIAQKTLLVEKTGKSAKYYYHVGDKIKLTTQSNKTVYKGVISEIRDSSITISSISSDVISINDITCVYKQFPHVRKLGIRLGEFGVVIFLVMVANNLITNSQVFTQYVFIVSGSFLGAGLISFALSERACKMGVRWKVKVLDGILN